MVALLQQYYRYAQWANHQIFELIAGLPRGLSQQELVSSFKTLHTTVQHMWLAEEVWWKRQSIGGIFSLESESFQGSFAALLMAYQKQATLWSNWLQHADSNTLNQKIVYKKQEQAFEISMIELVLHICNHATFHRGQLITMLRQLGITELPSTDFSTFLRGLQ